MASIFIWGSETVGSSLSEGNLLGRNVSNSTKWCCIIFLWRVPQEQTSLKAFLEKYDQILQTKRQLEALADLDSKSSSFVPKSRSYFELQVSKLYTNETLRMFEREVKGMFSCFNSRQINADGPVVTYIVQEQVEVEGNQRDARDYEVCYNEAEMEVLCICGLFNFRGCLCRHALFILSQNEIKEIPAQYILLRWRKGMKRGNVDDHNGSGIDFSNPVHRYDHLYRTGCEGCRGR